MPYFTFVYALFVYRACIRAILGPEYYIHFIGANGTKYTKFAHSLPDALNNQHLRRFAKTYGSK